MKTSFDEFSRRDSPIEAMWLTFMDQTNRRGVRSWPILNISRS
jgi:hypothetical protein